MGWVKIGKLFIDDYNYKDPSEENIKLQLTLQLHRKKHELHRKKKEKKREETATPYQILSKIYLETCKIS